MLQYTLYHFMPVSHIFWFIRHIQFFEHDGIHTLFFHQHRNLVNTCRGQILNYSFRINVAEHSHFFAHIFGNRTLTAADNDIRGNADAAQLFNAVLGRLGFELTCSSYIRNKCYMDIQDVVTVNFFFYLTDSFKERQAFNIADGTADLCNNKISIIITANAVNALFDFISNVRDYLHCTSQIIAPAFFIDNGQIDLASGHIGTL